MLWPIRRSILYLDSARFVIASSGHAVDAGARLNEARARYPRGSALPNRVASAGEKWVTANVAPGGGTRPPLPGTGPTGRLERQATGA